MGFVTLFDRTNYQPTIGFYPLYVYDKCMRVRNSIETTDPARVRDDDDNTRYYYEKEKNHTRPRGYGEISIVWTTPRENTPSGCRRKVFFISPPRDRWRLDNVDLSKVTTLCCSSVIIESCKLSRTTFNVPINERQTNDFVYSIRSRTVRNTNKVTSFSEKKTPGPLSGKNIEKRDSNAKRKHERCCAAGGIAVTGKRGMNFAFRTLYAVVSYVHAA